MARRFCKETGNILVITQTRLINITQENNAIKIV